MNLPMIATLGGHSALEIGLGAKKVGFRTIVIAQKDREKTYTNYFNNLFDDYILVDSFGELTDTKVLHQLQQKECIFIPHRYCQVYCDLNKLESTFTIPVFGNKFLLKYEEREGNSNQYQLMDKAQIPYPKRFTDPKKIDRLVLVKVREAERNYERAFFFASSYDEYQRKSHELIDSKKIRKSDLDTAVIEEYIVGAQVNFNFFYSKLVEKIELLGTDTRRQTNIDGLVRIPSKEQKEIENVVHPSYIETGHIAVTVKESLLEKAFILAEKLVFAAKSFHPKGIIGPFALQTVIVAGPPDEKIIVFDLSLRIPGSPGTAFTPYSQYHYWRTVSFGERIAMEIKQGMEEKKLDAITT